MSASTLTTKQAFLLERWRQILNDPALDQYDDTCRIETDANGEVLMSPRPPNTHNLKAFQIAAMIERRLGPRGSGETRILTGQGIKAADAIWCPTSKWPQDDENDIFLIAPEICIEVLSPRNTRVEIDQKRALYFAAGAREVWVCNRNNRMSFFDPEGRLEKSNLCPDFPAIFQLY